MPAIRSTSARTAPGIRPVAVLRPAQAQIRTMTPTIVSGFSPVSLDSRRILWLSGRSTLSFIQSPAMVALR